MSSPKIICKIGYTKNTSHYTSILNYAANKVAGTTVIYKDGSQVQYTGDEIPELTPDMEKSADCFLLAYKDGGAAALSYAEYLDLTSNGAAVHVSDLIAVTDDNRILGKTGKPHDIEDLDFFKYLNYTGSRRGVVKSEQGHGLFGVNGSRSMEEAAAEAEKYSLSRKWVGYISLPEGADVDTGFDKRELWQAAVSASAPKIARLYNISLENLVIDAAFHNNTDNAHIHLSFYSRDKNEGFIKGGDRALQTASEKLKSTFLGLIYKDDAAKLGHEKTAYRDELRSKLDFLMLRVDNLSPEITEHADKMLKELHSHLAPLKGKIVYEYLPVQIKSEVDKLLRFVVSNTKELSEIYAELKKVQSEYIGWYIADPKRRSEKLEEFEKEFFSPSKGGLKLYHNLIVKTARDYHEAAPEKIHRTAEVEIDDYTEPPERLSSLLQEYETMFLSEAEPEKIHRTAEGEIGDYTEPHERLSSPKAMPDENGGTTAKKSDNQKYYDVLSKYRSYNKPLSKALYRSLSSASEKTLEDIHASMEIVCKNAELVSTGEMDKADMFTPDVVSSVSTILNSLIAADPDCKMAVNKYLELYAAAIEKDLPETAKKYQKRFVKSFYTPKSLMRIHYSIVSMCEHHDDDVFGRMIFDKALYSPLTKLMRSKLKEAICDSESYISEFISTELKSMKTLGGTGKVGNMLKLLYDTDEEFRCALDNHLAEFYGILSEKFSADKANSYLDRYARGFFDSKGGYPLHRLFAYAAQAMDETIYRQTTWEHRHIFDPLSEAITESTRKAMWSRSGGSELRELITKISELSQALSKSIPTEKNELIEYNNLRAELKSMNTKAFADIYNEEIAEKITQCSDEFSEIFRKLTHDDANSVLALENRFLTDIFAGENSSVSFAMKISLNPSRQSPGMKIVFQIARLMCMQSINANNQNRENSSDHNLQGKKQFKNKKSFYTAQFTEVSNDTIR